ncbi:MAG: acetyl-CoA carboxylase biotin carboxylase subunit [Sporomusaceae bacterium]|nr:acetyl-CoA carboxylase biotin carboxylase subunit [Sporomusaceae bacterium]
MFNRLLIANRGEIAVRIIRACQELGVKTVAVYSDADVDSLHVQLADYSCRIGPADAVSSYLNSTALINAAKTVQADAIHPGYGFLSENAEFAEAVTAAGLTFVGPTAATLNQVGNKDAARAAMKTIGIPLIEGSGLLTTKEATIAIAREVGYPVILKPSTGGGGHGMIICNTEEELLHNYEMLESAGQVHTFLLEHYITGARHIEVQILADHYGHTIHLGERECSLQRRNQKLLEECPSSALTSALRNRVGELAVRAAKAVHYRNIGTVEFLMDHSGNFYFMEINPRVQVEHGITELVTGVDLVKKQIKIAAGKVLNLNQEDIAFHGHAIECRINAEDPAQQFLPSAGTISIYHQPGGPSVRVDSGVMAGSTIQPYYDSLIAKVMVLGRSRGEAIRIMERALAEYRIGGIHTTIPFHQQVLSNALFCSGDIDTQFVAKKMAL